ncbi:P-loop containing nucleoside triphosphate hydrolase protein [Nemania serpens]|nr:P-loop containing nucleoside triphosphate hydrolase protein [Nemania serpens]
MDPLSITAGAIGLLGAVAKTISAVTSFIRSYREARTDLTAVNRELLELQIVLELLRDDSDINENSVFPDALRAQVLSVITNCNTIVKQINTILEKHDASKSTPLKWVASGKKEIASLKMSLEAHRGSLNLALEMINISVSKSTKEDTTVIRSDVAVIKQDTSQIAQILEELATLREIVANIRSSPQAAGSNYILQQYLDSLTSYAETVVLDDLIESDNYSAGAGMDFTSPHERLGEDHTPSIPSTHSLPSNVAMTPTESSPEIQSGNNSQASNTEQSQGNLAFDITKSLICVGDSLIGKTAFLVKWSQGCFIETYSGNSIIDNKSVKFTIRDTPGQEEFERVRAPGYRDQDVVLICFNIVEPDSFDNIKHFEVLHYCHEIPFILVGLKKDLRFDPETLNRLIRRGEEPVSPQKGEDFRKQIGAFSYIECSAKTSEGIHEVFCAATRATKSKRKARWSRLFNKS